MLPPSVVDRVSGSEWWVWEHNLAVKQCGGGAVLVGQFLVCVESILNFVSALMVAVIHKISDTGTPNHGQVEPGIGKLGNGCVVVLVLHALHLLPEQGDNGINTSPAILGKIDAIKLYVNLNDFGGSLEVLVSLLQATESVVEVLEWKNKP